MRKQIDLSFNAFSDVVVPTVRPPRLNVFLWESEAFARLMWRQEGGSLGGVRNPSELPICERASMQDSPAA